MSESRIVVLLPAYNAVEYVRYTVDSLRSQSLRDFVVVANDDGSSDGTYKYLESIAAEDKRFVVSRNQRNIGMARNWNQCLRLSEKVAPRADYLLKLDADDLLSPSALEIGVRELDQYRTAALGYFQEVPIRVDASVLPRECDRSGVTGREARLIKSRYALRQFVRFDNFMPSSGTMVRRSVLRRLVPPRFDESLRWAVDYELWTRLAREGDLLYLPEARVGYRQHAGNVTANTQNARQRYEALKVATTAFRGSLRTIGWVGALGLTPWWLLKTYHLARVTSEVHT